MNAARQFNDAQNRYGLEHICDYEAHSLLLTWLLAALGLTVERLYRPSYCTAARTVLARP